MEILIVIVVVFIVIVFISFSSDENTKSKQPNIDVNNYLPNDLGDYDSLCSPKRAVEDSLVKLCSDIGVKDIDGRLADYFIEFFIIDKKKYIDKYVKENSKELKERGSML